MSPTEPEVVVIGEPGGFLFAPWELSRLEQLVPRQLLDERPPTDIQDIGDGEQRATSYPYHWWSERDAVSQLLLTRCLADTAPGRWIESLVFFEDKARTALARFTLLLASTVTREHSTGDSSSRSSSADVWRDESLPCRLRQSIRALSDELRIAPEIRQLARRTADHALAPRVRGHPGGTLEISLLRSAGLRWFDHAIGGTKLTRGAPRSQALRDEIVALLAAGKCRTRSHADQHELLRIFSDKYPPSYGGANLTHLAVSEVVEERASDPTRLALAALGLVVLAMKRDAKSEWRGQENEDLDALSRCETLPHPVRSLASSLLRRSSDTQAEEFLERFWDVRDAAVSAAVPESHPESPRRLQRRGTGWIARFDGSELPLKKLKGVDVLAWMLGHPNQHVDALAFTRRDRATASEGTPVLDEQARRECRNRLRELKDQATEEALSEMKEVETFASRAGMGVRRDRRLGSDFQKATEAVKRNVRRLLAGIDSDSDLGKYLLSHVNETDLVYQPSDGDPAWEIRE